MTKQTPNYFAVIPAPVRYDKRLTEFQKLLYGEVSALSNLHGHCWASNGYFAGLYEKTERTISKAVGALERCGYIKTRLYCREGKQHRIIKMVDRYVPALRKIMGD